MARGGKKKGGNKKTKNRIDDEPEYIGMVDHQKEDQQIQVKRRRRKWLMMRSLKGSSK